MCYNLQSSITAFTVGLLSAVYAFSTKQYVLGFLLLAYIQMQLSEAIIWRGIDTDNVKLNRIGTSYGKYLLATHNLAIGLGILFVIIFIQKRVPCASDYIPFIVGLAFFIGVVVFIYSKNDYPTETYPYNKLSTQECNKDKCSKGENRLKWPYPHSWYFFGFLISLTLMIVYMKPTKSKVVVASFYALSFLMSYVVYPNTVGSVWCFFAAIMVPLLVIVNSMVLKDIPSQDIFS